MEKMNLSQLGKKVRDVIKVDVVAVVVVAVDQKFNQRRLIL